MVKSDVLHMRIAPEVKSEADSILARLGITTTDAVNMFLNQIILRGGLPFDVRLPAPNETTRQAMREAEEGANLRRFGSAGEMFKELGIE
jgi:DNA-damage-inducible protein J